MSTFTSEASQSRSLLMQHGASSTTAAVMPLGEALRARRSSRGFLPDAVPEGIIQAALQDAQYSPSNCNTQPWNVHIVSGAKRDELADALLRANAQANFSPDFSFDMETFYGPYRERQNAQGKSYYESLEVAIDDLPARQEAAARNYRFFDAPHAAFLFMPSFGDNVRVAADIGMYAQSFLLALAGRGIGSIPQTSLGFFADVVRDVLGVSAEFKLLFGISFGYHDDTAKGNTERLGRASLTESVTLHR